LNSDSNSQPASLLGMVYQPLSPFHRMTELAMVRLR
jgi:hypothetical protein